MITRPFNSTSFGFYNATLIDTEHPHYASMTYQWDGNKDITSYKLTLSYTSDDGYERYWSGHVRFASDYTESHYLNNCPNGTVVDIVGHMHVDGTIIIEYLSRR